MGYSPWGHKELDTTEWLTFSLSLFIYLLRRVLVGACRVFVASYGIVLLWHRDSLVVVRGYSSCGTQAKLFRGIEISVPWPRTCILCIARWILIHWTTRGVPTSRFFRYVFLGIDHFCQTQVSYRFEAQLSLQIWVLLVLWHPRLVSLWLQSLSWLPMPEITPSWITKPQAICFNQLTIRIYFVYSLSCYHYLKFADFKKIDYLLLVSRDHRHWVQRWY